MRPVEALLFDRVDVIRLVGVLVMVAVMRRPPQRALLGRHAAQPGEHELEPARGLEGPVREVAMVATGDAELSSRERVPAQSISDSGSGLTKKARMARA
jgi:hypothetical protein